MKRIQIIWAFLIGLLVALGVLEGGDHKTGGIIEGASLRPLTRRVVITAAQVLALNATPITILPAPGANLANIFLGAIFRKPSGVAYAGIAAGEDLAIKYTNASGKEVARCETTGFLDSTGDQVRWVIPHAATSGVSDITPVANAVFVLELLSAEIITGDSDIEIELHYAIVKTVP